MALDPLHRDRQLKAIEIQLAAAPKIQEDLKAKFGYGENKFFDLDLIEYRINNSLLDIAEDLDVKSLYGIEKNKSLEPLISVAFRGHHNKEFMPDYQFNGLLGKETNDMIKVIRAEKGGRENGHIGGLIGGLKSRDLGLGYHGRTPEKMSEHGLIGGRKIADMINPETEERYVVEAGRKGGRIGGLRGHWRDNQERLEDICELRNEGLTWKETTSEMNEKYGENYTTRQVTLAYHRNKDLPSEEEE